MSPEPEDPPAYFRFMLLTAMLLAGVLLTLMLAP